jgi:hypothetical protein
MALCIEEGAMNINYFEGVVMKGGERKREGRRFEIGSGYSHANLVSADLASVASANLACVKVASANYANNLKKIQCGTSQVWQISQCYKLS